MSSGVCTGGGGPSRRSGNLAKNSVIKCTIDDLQLDEGLLVVSFTHKDNLFQGVLLQLNRERGIPAGISFPKDFSSEEKKSLDSTGPVPVPAIHAPPPPITQRNTYFQETENGRQYRTLRRVIKTPARFKNSRMSLRPVHRPVLCGKCGALCNEKNGNNFNDGGDNASENSDKVKKSSGDKKPQSQNNKETKDNKDKLDLIPKVKLSKISSSPNSDNVPIVDSSEGDYNYVGMGSYGVVENAWKRPVSKPLKCPQAQQQSSSKGSSRRITKILKAPSRLINSAKDAQSSDSPVFRISRPSTSSRVDASKANNLKLCIKKLTMAKMNSGSGGSSPSTSTDNSFARQTVAPMKMKIIPIANNNTKLRLIKRRNSTLPYRRGGKSPTWRTRKISTMSDDTEDNKGLNTNSPPCADDPMSNLLNSDRAKRKEGLHLQPLPLTCEETPPLQKDDLSPIQSPEEFSDSDVEGKRGAEPASTNNKTPVIKITFGSSGNGMVVQISPKEKHHQNHTKPETEELHHQDSSLEAKAVRKALKKARKEAKKKYSNALLLNDPMPPDLCSSAVLSQSPLEASIPPEIMPSLSPSSSKPALTPITIQLNSHCHSSEMPPTLEEEGELGDLAGERISRKRKKSKRKKKQKDHKENDNELESCEALSTPTIVNNALPDLVSSPVLKSEPNNLPPSTKRRRNSSGVPQPLPQPFPSPNNETPQHQRVCISLKRLKNRSNSYIPWNTNNCEMDMTSEQSPPEEHENEEPHCFQDASFEDHDAHHSLESIESYSHPASHHVFIVGEVVWGKSTGCPWWPGRIVDIILRNSNQARAKIAWYKSTTQSLVDFTDVHPFQEYFEMKYMKNRKRGSYQQAVREAVTDAHQFNPQDLLATD